jgi:hypothetical protein
MDMLSADKEQREEHLDRIAALEAENAELRKDADRYRWLQTTNTYSYVWVNGVGLFGDKLDAAIDAAMKEAQS